MPGPGNPLAGRVRKEVRHYLVLKLLSALGGIGRGASQHGWRRSDSGRTLCW